MFPFRNLFQSRVSFTVPATSGDYAPERINFCPDNTVIPVGPLRHITAFVESLAAASAVELWLLKVGGDPTADADFVYSGSDLTAAGFTTWDLASYPGAQIRVKSGGTAGATVVSASAD